MMRPYSVFRFSPRQVLAGALLLAIPGFAGCRDLTGDQLRDTGSVEVLVQDEAGTPLVDVTVAMSRVNDVVTHRTANNGVVRFDLVEVGERTYTVRNPTGYTGGGDDNPKTVTVATGQVAKSTFTLTKIATASAGRP